MKSVVYECPKGVFTRIMPGSYAHELYEEWRKNPSNGGTKQNPKGKVLLDAHMIALHSAYMKYQPDKQEKQYGCKT